MNLDPHFDALITGLITSAIGAISIWWQNLTNKRKLNAEATSAELDNVDKAIAIYREAVEDLKKEMEEMKARHDDNVKEIQSLKQQLDEVDKQWKKKLGEKNDYWLKRYKELENQFEDYKKLHP